MKDSITIVTDSLVSVSTPAVECSKNYGICIYIGIVLVIIWMIISFIKTKKKQKTSIENIEKDINWGNKLQSMFQAKALYNELKVKYHPDRFLDSTQNKIANELFQEITKNQHDFHKLEQLKQIAQEKLIRNEYDRS